MIIIDKTTGGRSTFKKFREENLSNCLSFKEVIERYILTRHGIEKLVASGGLRQIKYKNKRYIVKDKLLDFLRCRK